MVSNKNRNMLMLIVIFFSIFATVQYSNKNQRAISGMQMFYVICFV